MRMRAFRFCLCVSLLALWGASGAAASDGDSPALPEPAEVGLTFSPESVSAIPVDEGTLEGPLCGTSDASFIKSKCMVTIKHLSGQFKLAQPVETSCGLWDATGTSYPPTVRPGSLVLRRSCEARGTGIFAGAFQMRATLHLTHRETGRTVDVPLSFGFSLAGPWALASPEETPTTENVIFLANVVDGELEPSEECVPPSFLEENPGYVLPEGCEICLVPSTLSTEPEEDFNRVK